MRLHDPAADRVREALERADAARVRLADALQARPDWHDPNHTTCEIDRAAVEVTSWQRLDERSQP